MAQDLLWDLVVLVLLLLFEHFRESASSGDLICDA